MGKMTNCPWKVVDARFIEKNMGFKNVVLLNDFAATGYGILEVKKSDVYATNDVPRTIGANMCVLGAGTGLGNCYMVSQAKK